MEIVFSVLFFVFVQIRAEIILVPSSLYAIESKDLTLTCIITNPSKVIIWTRDHTDVTYMRMNGSTCLTLDGGKGLSVNYKYNCTDNRTYKLVIPRERISQENTSEWQCKDSSGGSRSNVFALKLAGAPTSKPVVTGYNNNTILYAGNILILTCSVKGGTPLATLCWRCKGNSVTGTIKITSTTAVSELVLNIDSSYNGQICVCEAKHLSWITDKKAESQRFIVYYKPVIAETIKLQEQNRHVEILVDFYSVPKPLKVDWIKEASVVSLSEKYRQSNTVIQVTLTLHEVRVQLKGYRAKITITNVTDDDFGTYVLRIENVKGIATQQVNYQRKNQQIEEKGETNAHDSTVIGIVIGASVTVSVTVTVVIVIYFARRKRTNKNENETVKMNEKIESKYEELQVRTAQELYDAPGNEVLKNIYINDVGDKDHYGHSKTEEDKAEYEEIQRIRP